MTKISDVLLGVAYGDSWGFKNEFHSYRELTVSDVRGPDFPQGAIISDDSQMTLSLAKALDLANITSAPADEQREAIQGAVVAEWVNWLHDPDNDRAPGNTCLTAARGLDHGMPWYRAAPQYSSGCGAVMRVAPVAFLPDELARPVSAWQAASTHGGSAAISSSIVMTLVLRRLLSGKDFPDGLISGALEFCQLIDPRLFSGWIAEHPFAEGDPETAAIYVKVGLLRLEQKLEEAQALLPKFRNSPWIGDPSETLAGWHSPDALACALLCADMLPNEPIEALRRATVTDGDSDSIAAITGAILGAKYDNPWPDAWYPRLETRYRNWIADAVHYNYGPIEEVV